MAVPGHKKERHGRGDRRPGRSDERHGLSEVDLHGRSLDHLRAHDRLAGPALVGDLGQRPTDDADGHPAEHEIGDAAQGPSVLAGLKWAF